MLLSQKETDVIHDLQTQEKNCAAKYRKYAQLAKDPVLKDLFEKLEKEEEKHFDSLRQVLDGTIPTCDCNCTQGKDYTPTASYRGESSDKANDCFLATDCIASEKMVSGEYNSDVFRFENSDIRKLLADIQIEEQNHAEMIYKYKTINHMC